MEGLEVVEGGRRKLEEVVAGDGDRRTYSMQVSEKGGGRRRLVGLLVFVDLWL